MIWFLVVLFQVLTILLLSGKGSFLIAGYVFLAVGIMLSTGQIEITVEADSIVIDGSYWKDYTVQLGNIESVSYVDTFEVGKRTNRLGSFKLLEGHFRNTVFGDYILYAYKKCDRYIVLDTSDRIVVLNAGKERLMNIKKSKYNITIDVLCVLLWVGIWIYLALNWSDFPDKIPGHYGAAGAIDRWGNKGELLVIPIMGCLMSLGLTVIERFPQIWNTGVAVTPENRERVYRILKHMLCTEKFSVSWIFSFLAINSTLAKPLPSWFTPVSLGLTFVPITFFLIKLKRAK